MVSIISSGLPYKAVIVLADIGACSTRVCLILFVLEFSLSKWPKSSKQKASIAS